LCPAAGEEVLVVADQVLLEDGDVALGGLQVEVAEQLGADVDRQAAVDQIGDEQAAEVVWGELVPREALSGVGQFVAEALQNVSDGACRDHTEAADRALE